MSPQRIDYYDSPEAPKANSLVPAVNGGRRQRRSRDPADPPHRQRQLGAPRRRGRPWRVRCPGRGRETLEESGIECAIIGIVGIYSDPRHVILYTSNGEARQEFSIVLTARPLAGRPTPSSESSEVRWVAVSDVHGYTMDRSMRIRIKLGVLHLAPTVRDDRRQATRRREGTADRPITATPGTTSGPRLHPGRLPSARRAEAPAQNTCSIPDGNATGSE
jgi:hypothetical protein